MDWEVTEDYCRSVARDFNVPIYLSWKEGGFKRELLRNNQETAPMVIETPDGRITVGVIRGFLIPEESFHRFQQTLR